MCPSVGGVCWCKPRVENLWTLETLFNENET